MKKAFTLAEVLITLAIIGVVAAISIPSVISNTQQQEFKTGLRKAVSVLNSAITMNMAIDGESPYDNGNLMGYLMRHMSVIESTNIVKFAVWTGTAHPTTGQKTKNTNAAFYTTDGMRFEFGSVPESNNLTLHENRKVHICGTTALIGTKSWIDWNGNEASVDGCGGCGSYGLNNNVDGTTKPPCIVMVDVNGDRKPNPANVNCTKGECAKKYKFSDPLGLNLTDLFSIMITDKQVIPYGVAAQRAMYQAQAKK